MSWKIKADMHDSYTLTRRVTAAAAAIVPEITPDWSPEYWALSHAWAMGDESWVAAWDLAVTDPPTTEPGSDEAVITDAMITAWVTSILVPAPPE